jgi:hypothetical protein
MKILPEWMKAERRAPAINRQGGSAKGSGDDRLIVRLQPTLQL